MAQKGKNIKTISEKCNIFCLGPAFGSATPGARVWVGNPGTSLGSLRLWIGVLQISVRGLKERRMTLG